MSIDLSFLQEQLNQHAFLVGVLAGTILPALAGPIIKALTKASISLTAKAIPPMAAAVRRGVVLALNIPLVRAVVVPHKEEIKKLEDAIVNALTAIMLALDLAFDEAIDEAAKPVEPHKPSAN